jgi:thymidylate synthase
MNADYKYLMLAQRILTEGEWKENRTGVRALTVAGDMFQYNMKDGFPLLTTRKLPYKSTKVELEFFIKGLSDKKWLQDRDCHYWDFWCNPQKVPYGTTDESKQWMREENDLGRIYGVQWRNFSDTADGCCDYGHKSIDQLKNIVNTLKSNPLDRRMICSAWNPLELDKMALPPCHLLFQVTVIGNRLNLFWYQRSVDFCCGLPANIASYATLLHLLAKESNLQEGTLTGFLADLHIYEPHIENLKLQMKREPFDSPKIQTEKFTSIFDWQYNDTELINYKSHEKLTFEVAV